MKQSRVRHYKIVSASAFFNAQHWGLLGTVPPSAAAGQPLSLLLPWYASLQGASFLQRSICSVSYEILALEINVLGKASFPNAILYVHTQVHCIPTAEKMICHKAMFAGFQTKNLSLCHYA